MDKLNTMYDNEMILTENNIDKAVKFIGATGYKRNGNTVTFFNASTIIFDDARTNSINTAPCEGKFAFVSIGIGSFIFTNCIN